LCGIVSLLRDRQRPELVITARLFCKRKVCPNCGPRRREALARHYTFVIGDTPVVCRTVARSTWATMARRLRRAGASYLRIPAPGGYVVFATDGPGDPVGDLAEALAAAFTAMPSDLARVSSSRCWSVAPPAVGGGGGGGEAGGYELLGVASHHLSRVVKVAKDLGIYVGQVADRQLAPDWAEAHLLRVPPDDPLVWRRFTRWIGLHDPDRQRRRRSARAA
jgi:hypothetical protein